jgi:PAS domain S-box-containing protein
MSYSRSLSVEDPKTTLAGNELSDTMKQQLAYSQKLGYPFQQQQQQQNTHSFIDTEPWTSRERTPLDTAPLPRTLADAFRVKSRAVVVTEAVKPFRVADVNLCWEKLCGYTYCEAKGKTLGSLLQGPETDVVSATALIAKLFQGEEAGTTLINYTKEGRRFVNRIRVGPLMDEVGNVTHFVGILQEIASGALFTRHEQLL